MANGSPEPGQRAAATGDTAPSTTDRPSERALVAGLSLVAGALVTAATNAVAIATTVPWPRGGVLVRLAHHGADAAQLLTMGLAGGALLAGWHVAVRAPRWVGFAVYGAASTALVHAILSRDLMRQALVALEGKLTLLLFWTFVVLCGFAVPTAHWLGAFLSSRRRLWPLPIVLALGGIAAHHWFARDDYPGFHAGVAWAAATISGAAIAPRIAAPLRSRLERSARARAIVAGVLLVSVLVTIWPTPNWLRRELFREPGAVGAWALAATLWSPPSSPPVDPPTSPWFSDRGALPDIPATQPRLFDAPPVVVFVTIDALRADVLERREYEAKLPTLTRLKRTGVWFSHATSPGTQTAVSLTSTFAGQYFSQMRWGMFGEGSGRFAYAAGDRTPRFPELLLAAGVPTVTYTSLLFLGDEFGVIRGFAERKMIAQGRRHAFGRDIVEPVIARLRRAGPGPLFVYIHLMEPHHPYDRGEQLSSEWERYVSEIAVADGLLGKIEQLLQQRFGDRSVLVVAADHGEAFGEHGTWQHTKTLYEELLRVPLLVRAPGIVPRKIDRHVTLVDLGPTILDLYGLPTPRTWMGQSLVQQLAGKDVELDRPILAEGRLRRALFWDGLKVIEDERRKTVEVFDLERDPQELDDLWDSDRARAENALGVLRAFFGAHSLTSREPGYAPPFKP